MQFKKLDRSAPISKQSRRKTIEDTRELVAGNEKGIKVSKYGDVWRVSIYRNTIKVAAIEIQNGLTKEQVREGVKKEILAGTFDEELTVEYSKLYEERIEKKRAKKLENGE